MWNQQDKAWEDHNHVLHGKTATETLAAIHQEVQKQLEIIYQNSISWNRAFRDSCTINSKVMIDNKPQQRVVGLRKMPLCLFKEKNVEPFEM
jgi:hypothetical protein